MFKGWVDVEAFSNKGHKGSFCVMQRDIVSLVPGPSDWESETEHLCAIGQSHFVAAIMEGVDLVRGG